MSENGKLPKGWAKTVLPNIAEVNPAKVKLEIRSSTPINFVPMKAVVEGFGGIDISELRPFAEVQKGYTQFRDDDVIFAKITPCMENGKLAIVPPLACGVGYGSTEFHVIRHHKGIPPKWIAYFLSQESIRRDAKRNMTGTAGQLRVPERWLTLLPMPLAPEPEQHRIVAKIEELFSDLDAGIAGLQRVKANLKRYRASVLKAAVSGKLTEKWRARNKNVQPASQLLQQILTERRKKWEQSQLAKFDASGKKPPEYWKDKYPDPAQPDTDTLPDLPKGWCWATIDAIGEVVGGVAKGQKYPKNTKLREIPYLRVANVQRGFLDLSEIKTIYAEEAEIKQLLLKKGDVLFNEGGDRDKLGRGYVWNGEIRECIHQNHVFRVRLFLPDMQPKFVSYHGNSFGQEWFLRTGKQSVNLASINMTVLRNFPVPIPPVVEQEQIVQEVEQRLSITEEAEAFVAVNLVRSTRLRQSILKKAFEGKLVLQDPKDEPAEGLLKSIICKRGYNGK